MTLRRLLCFASCGLFLPIVHGETADCRAAATGLFAALKAADAQAAQRFVFSLPGQRDRALAWVTKLCEHAKAAAAVPEVSATREASTIAIALVKDTTRTREGKADYDGVYFLKRDGKWLLVRSFPVIEDRSDVLTPDERRQLGPLREWEEAERKRLAETSANPKSAK